MDLASVESFFVHGSTTAMNCLLERKGARTAFVTTRGFRDIPFIGRFDRRELYNIKYKRTPPPVSRDLAFEVTERLDSRGEVLTPLDEEDVRRVAQLLKKKKVESVAVCFLHGFKNPVHERRTKDILLQEYPEISVSIASDIASEHREYERSMTTILDAYLKSTIKAWVADLENELKKKGFKGRIIITRSDGGGMTSELAMQHPIDTLLSGPSGGVTGGLFLSQNLGYKNMVTLDMGGTSCDVCTIRDCQAVVKHEARIGDWRLLMSNMNIYTIGAGGGSIAWLDVAGGLHVGPQSAAAKPGPICYGQGGVEPTITDAAMCIGYISPDYFLGGEMKPDVASAQRGIEALGKKLGMDLETCCSGIMRIALSNMAEAIRSITIEQGEDARDFNLLCIGGGGPLFAPFLISELEMPAAIVPIAPANFCALGMLSIDIRHDFSLTIGQPLQTADLKKVGALLDEMVQKGEATLESEHVAPRDRLILKSLDMRYLDQEHTVNVPLEPGAALDKDCLYEQFTKTYEKVWGYSLRGQPAAIRHLRVTTIGKVPKPKLRELKPGTGKPDAAFKGKRKVFTLTENRWQEYSIYERGKLLAGDAVTGPALVEEPTTVSTVPQGYRCRMDTVGNLLITRV